MGAVIGQPVLRVDGVDKFTGRLQFISDTYLPDSLVEKIFRSPVSCGCALYLDFEQARKVPGVHLVLDHEDVSPGTATIPSTTSKIRIPICR